MGSVNPFDWWLSNDIALGRPKPHLRRCAKPHRPQASVLLENREDARSPDLGGADSTCAKPPPAM
jgi:hypothetical protein